MSKYSRLVLTVLMAVLLSSFASHFVLRVLNIETKSLRRWTTNPNYSGIPLGILGSSLTYFGIDMLEISQKIGRPLANQWLPSASSCELEQIASKVPPAAATIIGISVYDQNERILCDYRSEFVPLIRTLSDLRDSNSDWSFSKRVITQYPLKYLRAVYPTAGRSLLVMIAAKSKLYKLVDWARGTHPPPQVYDEYFEKGMVGGIENWTKGHLQEQLTLLRNLCQGSHRFDGPKRQSLVRLIEAMSRKGPVVVVVLPVSPEYRREFIVPEIAKRWEQCLDEAKTNCPVAHWIRLDRLETLTGLDCYYDLAHMNDKGRKIATESLVAALAEFHLP